MSKKTKTWLIVAAFLVFIGLVAFCCVMSVLEWDFKRLSTIEYKTAEHKIDTDFKSISLVVDTADINIVLSQEDQVVVSCYEQNGLSHTVTVKDDTLVIEQVDTRKWYEHISIGFVSSKITVYLPEREYDALSIQTSTGDVLLESISAETVDIVTSTGDITVKSADFSGDVTIAVSTGDVMLDRVTCKSLYSCGTTGDLNMTSVISQEKASIKRSTGSVSFDGCDAAHITVKLSTGDVKGSLLSEKIFDVHSGTGRIDVPQSMSGGKCEIDTSTGDIIISVQ